MAARFEEQQRGEVFRVYAAKALQSIPQGKYVQADYWELTHPRPVDPRTGDEIAADVITRLGLEVV